MPVYELCLKKTAIVTGEMLCQFLDEWRDITGILRWVLDITEHGYSLQFRYRPPPFKWRSSIIDTASKCPSFETGSSQPARKRSDRVPLSQLESRFYSHYFVVPNRNWGLHPILDLRPINRVLHKGRVPDNDSEADSGILGTGLHP